MTEPQRLADLLADALDQLAERTATARVDARCGEPYPLAPEFCCTHPAGHDDLHGYDGPFPPDHSNRQEPT